MAWPLRMAVFKRGKHIAADRIAPQILLVHRVEHLRRNEQRHRGAFSLVFLNPGNERIGKIFSEDAFQFAQVLNRMLALPQRAAPFVRRHILKTGQSPPVRLYKIALQRIAIWLRKFSVNIVLVWCGIHHPALLGRVPQNVLLSIHSKGLKDNAPIRIQNLRLLNLHPFYRKVGK